MQNMINDLIEITKNQENTELKNFTKEKTNW